MQNTWTQSTTSESSPDSKVQDTGLMGWKINALVNKTMGIKIIENLWSKNDFTANIQPCNLHLLSFI
jgi:hypothetical protein